MNWKQHTHKPRDAEQYQHGPSLHTHSLDGKVDTIHGQARGDDMEHTLGPWNYQAKLSGSENHKGFRLWGSVGGAIAEIYPLDEDGVRGEANARLIAATPALLEALEAIEDKLHKAANGGLKTAQRQPRISDFKLLIRECRDHARAAIKQAKVD